MKAITENADISDFFFKEKLKLVFKHVLGPLYNINDYIIRYEFQHRGSIHAHIICCVENGITAIDLQKSINVQFKDANDLVDAFGSDDHYTDECDEFGQKWISCIPWNLSGKDQAKKQEKSILKYLYLYLKV